MDFLKAHQLNIMLVMNGACGILTLLVFFARTLSKRRRFALFMMEFSSVLLLIADRYGYLYLGNPSKAGYYIERIANYVLYVLPIVIFSSFNLYLSDLYTHEGGLKKVPKRLVLAEIFAFPSSGSASTGLSFGLFSVSTFVFSSSFSSGFCS